MNIIVAILLALHGVGHLVGFRSAFWPTPIDLSKRFYLGRKVDGSLWLLLALGFIGSAALLRAHQGGWRTLLLLSAGGSALMRLLSWPQVRIGLVLHAALLVLVFLLSPA